MCSLEGDDSHLSSGDTLDCLQALSRKIDDVHGLVRNFTSPETDTYSSEYDQGAVWYIVTVLVLYAGCLTVLMVKYVRRERQEANLDKDYADFVVRQEFQDCKFQNQKAVSDTKRVLERQCSSPALTERNTESEFLLESPV